MISMQEKASGGSLTTLDLAQKKDQKLVLTTSGNHGASRILNELPLISRSFKLNKIKLEQEGYSAISSPLGSGQSGIYTLEVFRESAAAASIVFNYSGPGQLTAPATPTTSVVNRSTAGSLVDADIIYGIAVMKKDAVGLTTANQSTVELAADKCRYMTHTSTMIVSHNTSGPGLTTAAQSSTNHPTNGTRQLTLSPYRLPGGQHGTPIPVDITYDHRNLSFINYLSPGFDRSIGYSSFISTAATAGTIPSGTVLEICRMVRLVPNDANSTIKFGQYSVTVGSSGGIRFTNVLHSFGVTLRSTNTAAGNHYVDLINDDAGPITEGVNFRGMGSIRSIICYRVSGQTTWHPLGDGNGTSFILTSLPGAGTIADAPTTSNALQHYLGAFNVSITSKLPTWGSYGYNVYFHQGTNRKLVAKQDTGGFRETYWSIFSGKGGGVGFLTNNRNLIEFIYVESPHAISTLTSLANATIPADTIYDPNRPINLNLTIQKDLRAAGYRIAVRPGNTGNWLLVYDGPNESFSWNGDTLGNITLPATNTTNNNPATVIAPAIASFDNEFIVQPRDVIRLIITGFANASNINGATFSIPIEFLPEE